MTETKRQFCVVPSEAVFDKRLSNADLRVVCALAAYADKEGRCWPSLQTVADRLGVSSRYVRTRLKAIERAGHITVVRNAGRSNRYTLGKGWNLGTIGSDQSGTIGSNQDLDPGTPASP
jgi:DNA-binding MarR family transcriptional regulator